MNVLRSTGQMESNDSEPASGKHNSGKTGSKPKLRIMNKNMAPPEENKFKVVLELTGATSRDDRPGVDTVAILDVCGSMKDKRLDKLKTAMKILLRKLRFEDRLSIITFSRQGMFTKNTQLQTYPLRPMLKAEVQKEIERMVNALQHVPDAPSIHAALRKALDVLGARDDASDRSAAIIIMSDGDPWRDHGDTTSLPLADVHLYKFSFAHEYKADGLHAIGNGGKGGTFPLDDVEDLSMAFSQCLDELCEVVVEDLELTFTPVTSDDEEMTTVIEKVYAGNCRQSRDDSTGSVTVTINGQLFSGEIRRFMVDVLLPAVSKQMTTNVLQITHSYTIEGERFDGLPLSFDVIRTGKLLTFENVVDNIERNDTRNMLEHGLDVLKDLLPFGRMKYVAPSKDQVPLQKDSPQPLETVEQNHNDNVEKKLCDPVATPPEESLPLDPLEHLKQQILMAIKYFDSIHDTMTAIEVTLNKAST